MYLTKAQ
jgi:transposase-like protein